MPPTLYVIRHAQGEHNVNNSHHIQDALLTDVGKAQCKEVQDKFPFLQGVQVILASPLRRAIQTAAYIFAPELEKRQIPVILVPNAQEISTLACDIGTDAEITIAEAPELIGEAAPAWDGAKLDTVLVDESWNSKRGIYASTLEDVRRRAAELRTWIYNRPEEHIALVTHGGFLHYLTEDWTGYVKSKGTGYQNCEYRKLEFTKESHGQKAHLRECGSLNAKQDRPPGLDDHLFHGSKEV